MAVLWSVQCAEPERNLQCHLDYCSLCLAGPLEVNLDKMFFASCPHLCVMQTCQMLFPCTSKIKVFQQIIPPETVFGKGIRVVLHITIE